MPTVSPMNMHNQTSTILDRSGPRIKTAALSSGVDRGGSGKWTTVNNRTLREPFAIGTWNVRSLSQDGKIELLAMCCVNIISMIKVVLTYTHTWE